MPIIFLSSVHNGKALKKQTNLVSNVIASYYLIKNLQLQVHANCSWFLYTLQPTFYTIHCHLNINHTPPPPPPPPPQKKKKNSAISVTSLNDRLLQEGKDSRGCGFIL